MRADPGPEIEEEDLFGAALALPVTERDAYLKRACGSNRALLARLTELLSAFASAQSFVQEDAVPTELRNRFGSYRLVRELGEGGCGVAYLAEQTAPIRRQVALKVIKPGMDTKAVIARFEAERQVLALLDHPNIAKVLDAGATPEGRPYFVMELVRGIKITEYCAQTRLTVPERLLLFIEVCRGVQHAHQKGIIHRDVKPSNVLVSMHDARPLVKIIDFGIAKATQGRLIDETLHTEIDQIIGTPAYISPEQARPGSAGVDTRSDIYSLGVLLYELLTGYTPFDPDELAEAGLEQLRERICTEQPVRPSRRLRTLPHDLLARVATFAATNPTKLVKQVQDDLDWIVMRCLEKEPARRYQSVNEVIADIDRYLRHEPVLARPPSLAYHVRRFAKRNRLAFASAVAAGGFVLLIAAFAIVMTIQANKIAIERDRAQREKLQAQKFSNVALNVFGIADPFHSLANEVTALAVLDRAATSIKRELPDDPAPRARLLQALGLAYVRRGAFKPAIDHLTDAVQTLTQMPGAQDAAMQALVDLSFALRLSGDYLAAREVLVRGERIAEQYGLQRTAGYAKLLLNRGRIHVEQGRVSEAHRDFEMSLELYREVVGSQSVEVAEVTSELSVVFQWLDQFALAEQTARESLATYDHVVPPMHPDRVQTEARLAEALYLQNRLDEAASAFEQALEKSTELFGDRSVEVADLLDKLAMVEYAQGRLDEAEKHSRNAVATARSTYGTEHALVANFQTTLGRTLLQRGKYSEAESMLREALDTLGATLPPDHQYIASAEYFLGEVFLATNRLDEAEAVLNASMNRWTRAGAPPWRAARSASALGEALQRQGRREEAAKLLSESFRLLSTDPGADADAKEKAGERVARFLKKPPAPQPTPLLETTDASP